MVMLVVTHALLVAVEEEGEEIGSEEENELMKEIRAEITNHVRQEMKSELDLYKHKMDKLEGKTTGTLLLKLHLTVCAQIVKCV